MQLKFEHGDFAAYHAALETVEGRQVWSTKLNAPRNAGAVEISIPSKLLKKDDYVLTLKGVKKEETDERVEDYAFTIDR